MFIVRFVSGGEKDLAAVRVARDERYETKREAIDAIRQRGFRPGPKILDAGRRVRLAYAWGAQKAS